MTVEHVAPTGAPPPVNPDDEATRYLAAASHFDPELADQLIEECLAEPYRAIAHTPGVHAATVLREAVAARAARSLVSIGVVALALLIAVFGFVMALFWLVSALAWRTAAWVLTRIRTRRARSLGAPPPDDRPPWWAVAALWFPLQSGFSLVLLLPLAADSSSFGGGGSSDFDDSLAGMYSIGSEIGVLIATLIIVCVLFVHRYLPWVLAERYFRFGIFRPDLPPREFVAWACRPFAARLARIAEQDASRDRASPRNLIIYRDHRPFVGAGYRVRSWSQAIELHNAESGKPGEQVPVLSAAELQQFIAEDVDSLRKSPDLAPGGRFAGLEITDTALLSAGHLLHYADAQYFVNELTAGRTPYLDAVYWQGLHDRSPEWLRYYKGFRIESWERQLAVAAFLHVGYEERTLYLEWNSFVLPPIAPEYRTVDTPPSAAPVRALWHALGDTALLPTTVPRRITEIWRWVRDVYGIGRGAVRTPVAAAQSLGTALTVREIGAGTMFPDFFQETDSDRYLKVLEQRVLDATRRFLAEKGVATEMFASMVTQINNSTVMEGCTIVAGSVGGSGNQGTVGATTANTTVSVP